MKNLVHPIIPLAVVFIFSLPRTTSRIDCDFEDDEMCGYTYNSMDHHGFRRIAGPPQFNCTGLDSDHTFSSSKGHYIYSVWGGGMRAHSSILSETYTPLSTKQCLEVWYYMNSNRLDCELVITFYGQGTTERKSDQFRWKGITNYRWDLARIEIYADSEPFKLNIKAITGYQARGLVAIDDISIKPWSCTVSSSGPDEAILDPRPIDVLEYTLLDVLCTCGQCLPACTVKWAFNDELFQTSDRLRLNASRDTEGRYTCNCINLKSFESKTTEFYLSVRFGPENAILDPALTQHASQEHSILNVSCHCDSCSPSCFVKWSFDGVYSGMGNDLQLNVTRDSVGNYSCTCINPVTYKSESTYFELTVRFGPDQVLIEPPLTQQTIQEQSPLSLSCTCGNCTPSCINTWYLNNVNVGNSSGLWFGNVSRNHGGKYTCRCTNPTTLKSESRDVDLTVNYGPDDVVLAPNGTAYTVEEFTAMIPVSCTCRNCMPSCTARWITNTVDVSFKDQCSLKLKNVTRNSAGIYICTCVNPYTSKLKSRQFNLIVQTKMITKEGTNNSAVAEASAKASESRDMTIIAGLGTGAGVSIAFLIVLLVYLVLGRKRRQHVNKHISENQNMEERGTNVKDNDHDDLPLQAPARTSAPTPDVSVQALVADTQAHIYLELDDQTQTVHGYSNIINNTSLDDKLAERDPAIN